MKNTSIFLLILLQLNISLFAQNDKIKTNSFFLSETSDISGAYKFPFGDEVLLIDNLGESLKLGKMNTKTLEFYDVLEFTGFSSDTYIDRIFQLKDRVFILYSNYNTKTDKESLFYREINSENATVGEEVLLLQSSGELHGSIKLVRNIGQKMFMGGKYAVFISPDSSGFVVLHVKKNKQETDTIHTLTTICAFGSNMEKEWCKEFKLPYALDQIKLLNHYIDKKSNSFILTAIKNKMADGSYSSEWKLLTSPVNSSECTIEPLALPGISFWNILICQNFDKGITGVGLYSSTENIGESGFFSFKTNISGNIYDFHKSSFPEQLVKQNMSEKELSKLEKMEMKNDKHGRSTFYNFPNLHLKEVHIQSDGSCLIIAQQSETVFIQNATTYCFSNIIVAKTDKSGRYIWMKKLPKTQIGQTNLSLSYRYFKINNKHYFFYCDNPENLMLDTRTSPKPYVSGKSGSLMAYIIDQDGNVEHTILMDMKDNPTGEKINFINLNSGILVNGNKALFEVPTSQKAEKNKILSISESE